MMRKILIVEDDMMIASGLVYALENESYSVTHCKNANSAYAKLQDQKFDLAILDMQLPDGDGFDVNRKLKNTDTHVIFLTVTDDENNIVRAFDEGASDYITKPFRLRELLARVRRTLNENENNTPLTIGEAAIDTESGKVYIGTRQIELTALEYRLLLVFAYNKSRLLTRNQILENIWDYSENFVEDNTLTVYVKRLREKLGKAVEIETVRGIGYRAN